MSAPIHAYRPRRQAPARRTRQAGLTLVELMVSVAIGLIMIAALTALIADQSTTRAEVDRSGRLIENGRYAAQTMASDIQLAGYWGEYSTALSAPGALPDPCATAVATLQTAMALHVQGYNAPATLPTGLSSCVSNHKAGTDVLVVRHADPDKTTQETAGAVDLTKLTAGQVYLQTGMSGTDLTFTLAASAGDTATDGTTFALTRRDGTRANMRKLVTHIYYISSCSVPVSGSCTSGDGGKPIPTLKRVELGESGGSTAWNTATIAEGIENMQIDYGVDSDNDGAPNGSDVDGSALAVADWANVVTMKIHLLVRAHEKSPAFEDTKSYVLGTAGTITPATGERQYKRHVFSHSVRLVNPSGRRAP
jgi:type IV pilus assembly protein PilW